MSHAIRDSLVRGWAGALTGVSSGVGTVKSPDSYLPKPDRENCGSQDALVC